MSKSYEMQTNSKLFNKIIAHIVAATKELTNEYQKNQVNRYIFFTVTGNVTLTSYVQMDQNLRNRCAIVSKIIDEHKDEIISSFCSKWKLNSEQKIIREKYLNRSINLLGNIRMNSGLPICIYFTVDELIDSSFSTQKSDFNSCIQYVIVRAKIESFLNNYALQMAISHFFLNNTSQDYILQTDEMNYLGIFLCAVAELFDYCGKYDDCIKSYQTLFVILHYFVISIFLKKKIEK